MPSAEPMEDCARRARAFELGMREDSSEEEMDRVAEDRRDASAKDNRATARVWTVLAVIAFAFLGGAIWLAVTVLHWLWTHPLF